MARLKHFRVMTTMDISCSAGARGLDFVNTVDPLVGPDAVDGVDSARAARRLGRPRRHHGVPGCRHARRRGARPVGARGADADLRRRWPPATGRRRPISRRSRRLRDGARPAGLAPVDGRYGFAAPSGVDAILLPVLESARELLTTDKCAASASARPTTAAGCSSTRRKNGSRRWCRMDGCGAKAKMRRYRARLAD